MWDDYDVGRQVGAAVSQMKTISEILLEELPGLEEKKEGRFWQERKSLIES